MPCNLLLSQKKKKLEKGKGGGHKWYLAPKCWTQQIGSRKEATVNTAVTGSE